MNEISNIELISLVSRAFVGGRSALENFASSKKQSKFGFRLIADYEAKPEPEADLWARQNDVSNEVLDLYLTHVEGELFTDSELQRLFRLKRSATDHPISLQRAMEVFGKQGLFEAIEYGSFQTIVLSSTPD